MEFIDLDRYIEQSKGASIMDIFRYEGEAVFRGYEREALEEICAAHPRVVVSAGGGTPCYGDNMSYMQAQGLTLYLRHSAAQLASRLSESRNPRPLIKGMSREELNSYVEEKLAEREEFYCRATLTVDSPSRNIASVLEKVREYLSSEGKSVNLR